MSENQEKYEVETGETEVREALDMLGIDYDDSQPAVIIEQPRTDIIIDIEAGFLNRKVWGWVKKSAKFVFHIRKLKGAKLAIFDVVCHTINEKGECDLSVKEICILTGYGRSAVIEGLKELEEMGYLNIKRQEGKESVYRPIFTARGWNDPEEEKQTNPENVPVRKMDGLTKPPPSTFSKGKSNSSIKESESLIYTEEDFRNMTVTQAMKIPTLKMYRKATDFFPGAIAWWFVHKFITENQLTYEKIHAAAVAWKINGFKSENIKGLLEWARDGINGVENTKKQGRNSKKSGNEANTSTPKVIAGTVSFLERHKNEV